MPASSHRYFVVWPDSSYPVEELTGPDWSKGMVADTRYVLALLAQAEPLIQAQGLHFYFTKDPDALPEYGPHVIAVLLLEERCKIPAYAHHVGAVIRNTETRPFLGFGPRLRLGYLEGVLIFEYLRDWYTHLRSLRRLRDFKGSLPRVFQQRPKMIRIPLGFHSQEPLPVLPMRERKLDTFFAGDIQNQFARNDYRFWTSTSKIQARRQLWSVLKKLRADPEWRIEFSDTSDDDNRRADFAFGSYSERMQHSRICVAPRGSMAETYRLYEGLRAGCLVICNRLPPLPFLQDAPILVVDDWKELPSLLKRYARDIDALEQFSAAGQRWWDERCGEKAFAAVLAEQLNQRLPG
jgi:hypothetical protein